MKALVYHGPEDLRYQDVTEPEPVADQVKLRVLAAGICGSDIHGYAGLTGRRIPPMIMGHEFSGEVVACGPDVKHLQKGDRVVPFPIMSCSQCTFCLSGQVNRCPDKRLFGVLDCPGAMAEYICLSEQQAYILDPAADPVQAAMAEPLAVAMHGLNKTAELAGKDVFIVGAGTIGLLLLALLRLRQPNKIVISDLSPYRLGVARDLGATHTIQADQHDVREYILSLTQKRGVDVSFECVGASATTRQALTALKPGGQAVWIGNSARIIETDMQEIVTRELAVTGSYLYTRQDFQDVIALASDAIDCTPLISQVIRLEQGPEMFRQLLHDPGNRIKVIIGA